MSAPPYMRLYWGDYSRKTRHLTKASEHGAYLMLIGALWDNDGKLPADDETLAAYALCTPDEWAALKPKIMPLLTVSRGKISQARVTEELAKYKSTSGKRKEAGKKGGSASVGKDSGNGQANASHLPTQSESKSESKKEDPLTPKGDDLFGGEGGEGVAPPTDDVREAFDLWNAMAPGLGLPMAKDLTETRRRAIRKRLAVAGLPGWREALAAVSRSKLCRGDNDRGWKADLDFVCQARSFTRLREGSYGADAKPPTSATITPICRFTGPEALRKTVVEEIDESFAVKFIDPAGWREADRTLIVRNAYADVEVRRELRTWLVRMKVNVEVAVQSGEGRAA